MGAVAESGLDRESAGRRGIANGAGLVDKMLPPAQVWMLGMNRTARMHQSRATAALSLDADRLPCGMSGRTGTLVSRERDSCGFGGMGVVRRQGAGRRGVRSTHGKPRGVVQPPAGRMRAFAQRSWRVRARVMTRCDAAEASQLSFDI
jgi:hypothetical protein